MSLIRVYVTPVSPSTYSAHRDAPDGELLVKSSGSPIWASAKALAANGEDLNTLLTMRHVGKPFDSFEPLPIWRWLQIAAGRTKGEDHEPQ